MCIFHAIRDDSFYFMIAGIIYGYIALTYLVFRYVLNDTASISVYLFYFIVSTVLLIRYLLTYKKKISSHDRMQ
jgi:hypothetical protein